jgi:hypothetical protein
MGTNLFNQGSLFQPSADGRLLIFILGSFTVGRAFGFRHGKFSVIEFVQSLLNDFFRIHSQIMFFRPIQELTSPLGSGNNGHVLVFRDIDDRRRFLFFAHLFTPSDFSKTASREQDYTQKLPERHGKLGYRPEPDNADFKEKKKRNNRQNPSDKLKKQVN